MEIKVGDKVRLSENYEMAFGSDGEGVVIAIMDECGLVALKKRHTISWISLCDLIKVEGEAKEPKFKRGDKVVSKSPFIKKVWTVLGYDIKMPYMVMVGDGRYINERNLEPYTESAEDEIIRQREAEFDEFAKEELDRVHHPEKYTTHEATIDNVAMDWTAYTADLAKDVALKVANKYNDPEQAAEYAVKFAKAVVEGLKRK